MGKRKHEADSVAEIKLPTTEGEVKSKKQKVKVKKEKAAQHGTPTQPAAAPESAAKPDKLKRKKKGNKRKKDKEKKKKRKDKEQQAAQQLANGKAHTPASQPQPDARGAEGPASTSGRKEGAQPGAGSKPEVSRKKSKPAAAPSPAASPAAAGVAVAHSAATPCVDVWRRRCLRFVELCSNSDSTDILSQGLGTWPTEDVLQLFKDCSLSLDTFGAVCYSWSAAKAAQVLGGMKGSEVAKVCESWDVERITEVLPLLEKDKLLRKVLGRLYFKSKDPYLAPFDCRGIVEALPMQRHTAVLAKFKPERVERVLNAKEGDDEDDSEGEDLEEADGDALVMGARLLGAAESADEYDEDDSFIDDGSTEYVTDLEDSM